MKRILVAIITALKITALSETSYGQEAKVIIVQPINLSGTTQLDWLSNTLARSIQLEMRKEKLKAEIADKIPENISPNDFVIVSSFKKSEERILFFMNIIRKGDAPIKNTEGLGIIDSFTMTFIPEVIYEAKSYISRIARLYVSSVIRFPTLKFKPVAYKFSPQKIVELNSVVGKIPIKGDMKHDRIILDPAEQDGWFVLGVNEMKKGRISEGLSYLSRYISKSAPSFRTEEDALSNENMKKVSEILRIALPEESKNRDEAIRSYIKAQFYGDFSDDEIRNLIDAISKDRFFWMAMRRLADIYFARGDYRSALTYFRDYISTTNESIDFVMVLSRSAFLVEELSRGF